MKLQKYNKFSRKLYQIARKKRIPLRAVFELTYRCNFRCIHCYVTEKQKSAFPENELKTKEVFLILDQLAEIGCLFLGFSGGEIFMRTDLLDILWYAKRKGFEIILLTNASFINKTVAKELSRLMPNKVDITVHAMHKDIFEQMTRAPGSYEKVFGAIDLLYQRNIPLGIKSCGIQENKEEIPLISEFAKSKKVLYRFDSEIMPRLDGSREPYKYLLSPQEMQALTLACYPEMFQKFDEKGGRRKVVKAKRRNIRRIFNCGAGYTDLAITPYGELKICIDIDYPRYKILDSSLLNRWQIIKDFVDNLKPESNFECKHCKLLEYCSWCPARSYLETGNFSACVPFNRRIAEFRNKLFNAREKGGEYD